MKRLILVRHAQAKENQQGVVDFTIPLQKKGIRDAHTISKKLKDMHIKLDVIISSNAVRALSTANIFAETLDFHHESIKENEFLYTGFTITQFLNMLKETDNRYNTVMVVGHNPTLTSLAINLLNKFNTSMPKGSAVGIDFDIYSWEQVTLKLGSLAFFEYPE